MGDYKGISLAEKLKKKADALRSTKDRAEYNAIREQIVKGAEDAASVEGDYEFTLYDDRLSDSVLFNDLKRGLKSDGFKVDGGLDGHYAGKDMFYIRVSWK